MSGDLALAAVGLSLLLSLPLPSLSRINTYTDKQIHKHIDITKNTHMGHMSCEAARAPAEIASVILQQPRPARCKGITCGFVTSGEIYCAYPSFFNELINNIKKKLISM